MYRFLYAAALLSLSGALLTTPARGEERPRRASLGIAIDPAADASGVPVREVNPDGPAAKAGLKSGDVITRVEDREIRDADTLLNMLAGHKPGDKLTLTVLRDGNEKTLTVTLGEREARPARAEGAAPERRSAFLGVQTMRMTDDVRSRFGVTADRGLVVAEVVPETPAARAGLQRGDVITGVDGKEVATPEDLRSIVQAAGPGKEITLSVLRGNDKKEIKARLEETPGDIGFVLPGVRPGLRAPFDGLPQAEENRKLQKLERQVDELEKRVRDLEKK